MANMIRLLLCYFLVSAVISTISSETDVQDAKVILSLKDKWTNTPSSWNNSTDPCGSPWTGITCNANNRVTQLTLTSAGLKGGFPDNIGNLTELISLDLSFNGGLTGPLSPTLGNLSKLYSLALEGCSFTGSIPTELGNAAQLTAISLAGNNLTGEIPSSLGKLSNLQTLDLQDNFLTGSIPMSGSGKWGIDQLKKLQDLVLDNNQLSGSLKPELFSAGSILTKLHIHGNKLTGNIPDTLYQLRSLQTIDLGENYLSGIISPSIRNLTGLTLLGLDNNNFTGPLPNLTGMINLNFVFLGYNSFDRSIAPAWFTSLRYLQVLYLEKASLYGLIPHEIFSLPLLNSVALSDNEFNGILDMSYITSDDISYVDFQNNKISDLKLTPDFNQTLLLQGNPYCQVYANAYVSVCQPYLP